MNPSRTHKNEANKAKRKSEMRNAISKKLKLQNGKTYVHKQSLPEKDNDKIPCSPVPDSSEACLEWLIHPVEPQQFFSQVWEKNPYLVKRHCTDYYQQLFSCSELDKILNTNPILFGKHLDITSYVDGVRHTHNPVGRAYPAVVWDYFQKGCSIRMLTPQTHSPGVWKVNSLLQTRFGSFVGANVYLTPKGTQGFAPHYDDIEAFILQLEGVKHWKVYAPRDISEELPRYSSPNFSQDEIGDPILNIKLEPGDLLYLPRGFIHQAQADENIHSLHITLSTYQKTSWADLFETIMPQAIKTAVEEDVDFRRSLPIGYLGYMGVAHSDLKDENRDAFLLTVNQLFKKLFQHLPVDGAVDQLGKQFIHDSLPHKLNKVEKSKSIHGNGDRWSENCVQNIANIGLRTKVRFINPTTVRLVMEDDEVRLYHSFENSRTYREIDPQYIEIGAELAPSIEQLLHSWPQHIRVEDLDVVSRSSEDKLDIVNLLYDKGLLATEKPLPLV